MHADWAMKVTRRNSHTLTPTDFVTQPVQPCTTGDVCSMEGPNAVTDLMNGDTMLHM